MKKIRQFLFRLVGYALLVVVVLCLLLAGGIYSLKFPRVQTFLVSKAQSVVFEQLGIKAEIGAVDFGLPKWAILRDVVIYDKQNVAAIKAKSIEIELISFSFRRYWYYPEEVQNLGIGRIELNAPQVILYKSKRNSRLNLEELFAAKDSSVKDSTPSKLKIDAKLSDFFIADGRFAFTDSTLASAYTFTPKRINFANLQLDDLHLFAHLERYDNGRVSVLIEDMSVKEHFSGFNLEKFSANIVNDEEYVYDEAGNCTSPGLLKASNIRLVSGKTNLTAYAELPDQPLSVLLSGEIPLQYYVFFEPSSFEFDILDYFVNPIPPRGVVKISKGVAYGSLNQVTARDLVADYGDDIHVEGNAEVRNFTDARKLTIDVSLQKSSVSGKELMNLLPEVALPDFLANIGKSELKGSFLGSYYDFVVDTELKTPLGNVDSDIRLQIPPAAQVKDFSYKGHVFTQNLNFDKIGILPKQKISENLNADLEVDGMGTDWKKLELTAKGYVVHSSLMGLGLDSAFVDMKIGQQKIGGYAWIDDGVGRVDADMAFDLSDMDNPTYKVKGNIQQFNFRKYKIFDEDLTFSGIVDVDMRGKEVDLITGEAKLTKSSLTYVKHDSIKTIKISDLYVQAQHPSYDSTRILVNGSVGQADIKGKFKLTPIVKDIRAVFDEIQLYFANDDSAIQAYYAQKVPNLNLRELNFHFLTGPELNRVFDFFNFPLYLTDKTLIDLNAKLSNLTTLNLIYKGDSIAYVNSSSATAKRDTIALLRPDLSLNFIKYADTNNLILNGILESPRIHYGYKWVLENNFLDLNALGTEVDIALKTRQNLKEDNYNDLQVACNLRYTREGDIFARFDPGYTKIHIADYDWRIQNESNIRYVKGEVFVDTLKIVTDSIRVGGKNLGVQRVTAYGMISKNPHLPLFVWVNQLSLATLDQLYELGLELEGIVNARVDIFDILNSPKLQINGNATGVSLGEMNFGRIEVGSRWDPNTDKIEAKAFWFGKKSTDTLMFVNGNYDLNSKYSPLDFTVRTGYDIPLSFFSAYLKDILYEVSGGISIPKLRLTGNFEELTLKGDAKANNISFGVDYLKAVYHFNGNIAFSKNLIELNPTSIFDKYGKSAELSAKVRHSNFRDLNFEVLMDKIRDMLVMETTPKDNELFHGTLFVKEGSASIKGNLQQIAIVASGSTGKNSIFKLPISYENTYGMPDFITFVGAQNTKPVEEKKGVELSIDITVEATDEAEAELIFDEKIGDKIQGKGNGTIHLVVTPQGDLLMNGTYEITEGKYLFTTQNAFGKSFEVRKGGKIVWEGDPADAQIDLDAFYYVPSANAKTLIGGENDVRIPAYVVMNLKGELMKPQISPYIELPSLARSGMSNQLANDLNAKIKSFEFSPEELNKQVMSLLLFNQFAPESGLSDGGPDVGSLATTSISEFFSNQLNYMLAKSMGENVNVSVNSSNFQDVNMMISARLFNDRVKVERDGTLVGNNTSFSLGNINVIVKLLPTAKDSAALSNPRSGELNLEVFNRNSIGSQQTNASQVGAGVFYKKDFDRLSDLWQQDRKKKKKPAKK